MGKLRSKKIGTCTCNTVAPERKSGAYLLRLGIADAPGEIPRHGAIFTVAQVRTLGKWLVDWADEYDPNR